MKPVYKMDELIESGVKLTETLNSLPKMGDLGKGAPSWETIRRNFGTFKAFREAVQLQLGGTERKKAMILAGLRMIIRLKRDISQEDFAEEKVELQAIVAEFGSWTDYHAEITPNIPPVNIMKNLVQIETLLDLTNSTLPSNVDPISDRDIRTWSVRTGHGLIPLARKAGRIGVFSKTLVPILRKIRLLQVAGLTLGEIKAFMAAAGRYRNLYKISCRKCNRELPGNSLKTYTTPVCLSCAAENN